MKIKFEKVFTDDYTISRFQTNVATVFEKIGISPFVSGSIVDATIGTSDTQVEHKLGRAYQGWLLVDKQGPGDVYSQPATDATREVTLKSTAIVKVKLYIF